MSSLLIEIFSEEIPAKIQLTILEKFIALLREILNVKENIMSAVSPRHICVAIPYFELASKVRIKGPKVSAMAQAMNGFLTKYNITMQDLIEDDGILYFEQIISQEQAKKELIQKIQTALSMISWPKSMRWNNHSIQWIRPIHRMSCILNDDILPIQLEHITASNITCGHISRGFPEIKLTSADFEDYCEALKKQGVIVSHQERKSSILNQISEMITPLKLHLVENDELLNEIVGLVENPIVFIGKIDQEFMLLPNEILITSLQNHQKYLLLKNEDHSLAPYFVIVSNINPLDGGQTIIAGNERVLRARLADAQHFLQEDLKIPFVEYTEKLHKIQFHKDIGSVYEKVQSVVKISKNICEQLHIDSQNVMTAAGLCKNDLVTQMVGEFPELQGIIGYYYAMSNSYCEEVAMAIRDHYKPCGPNDSLPQTLNGCILAIADKVNTLQSMFDIGVQPTSTKDPYALRRAAIGILRMICEHKILQDKLKLNISEKVREFIIERAKNLYKNEYLNIMIEVLNRK